MAYGMLGSVVINAQNSFGTAITTSGMTIPIKSENITLDIAQLQDPQMFGRFAESPRYTGFRTVKGDIDVVPYPTFLGTLLYAAMGQDAVTVSSLSTHKMRPTNTADWDATAAFPPFTLQIDRNAESGFNYQDMVCNGISLVLKNKELVTAKVAWLGGFYVGATKATPSFPTAEKPFMWSQVSANYNGNALTNLMDFTLDVKNNLEAIPLVQSSLHPSLIKRTKQVEVSGKATFLFQSNSLMADFLSPGATAPDKRLLLNLVSDVVSATLLIDIPSFRIVKYGPVISKPGFLEVPLDWVGEFNVGSSYQLEFTLINSRNAVYP